MKIRAAMAIGFAARRPASRQTPSRRKPPSTTMIVCISFLLPCDGLRFVGLRHPLCFFRLLVIVDDALQGADVVCRASLAGHGDGNRREGHVAATLVFHAASRRISVFPPGRRS